MAKILEKHPKKPFFRQNRYPVFEKPLPLIKIIKALFLQCFNSKKQPFEDKKLSVFISFFVLDLLKLKAIDALVNRHQLSSIFQEVARLLGVAKIFQCLF